MREITLHNTDIVAFVDDEDYERISKFRWHARQRNNTWYAVRYTSTKTIGMHTEVLRTPVRIDHKDRNGLNNQKENLREATHSINNQNRQKFKIESSSKFKGVHWLSRDGKWVAGYGLDNKWFRIGAFKTELEAAKAYDKKVLEVYGEDACTNESLGLF